MNTAMVPASPKPKSAMLITVEPKFDQLPTEKLRITANSNPIMEMERRKRAPIRKWICFKDYPSPSNALLRPLL